MQFKPYTKYSNMVPEKAIQEIVKILNPDARCEVMINKSIRMDIVADCEYYDYRLFELKTKQIDAAIIMNKIEQYNDNFRVCFVAPSFTKKAIECAKQYDCDCITTQRFLCENWRGDLSKEKASSIAEVLIKYCTSYKTAEETANYLGISLNKEAFISKVYNRIIENKQQYVIDKKQFVYDILLDSYNTLERRKFFSNLYAIFTDDFNNNNWNKVCQFANIEALQMC